jgi:serine/threonine protein kinase
MAPERARGQGGHASDIFSVGAVFYEFLTNRAPFSGEDPIEILDKLRTENPPRLSEVDPGAPLELCAIVERALAKDPTQRFANLGQMRNELMTLRRKRAEDTERLRQDVQGRLRQLHELKGALEARLGGPWADETVFVVDEHAPMTTLESVGHDTSTRIARLTELPGACRDAQAGARQRPRGAPRRQLRPGPSWSSIAWSARCPSTRTPPRACGWPSIRSPSAARARSSSTRSCAKRARRTRRASTRGASRSSTGSPSIPPGSRCRPRPSASAPPAQAALVREHEEEATRVDERRRAKRIGHAYARAR